MIKKLIRKKILNNKLVNPLLKLFKLDAVLNDLSQDYVDFKPDTGKSLQEIAGYSNKPEINETLASIHRQLIDTIDSHKKLTQSASYSILDIGCGPGLYLQNFKGDNKLTGIDISGEMCKIAMQHLKEAEIIHDHFLKHHFTEKYNAIYSIGVLIYFSRTQLDLFFEKLNELLKPGGIIFISYPHAFRKKDLAYHDYTYVHYSPAYLEKTIPKKFEVVHHMHQDQKTKIIDYDKDPFINANNYDNRSYVNSSILILKKK